MNSKVKYVCVYCGKELSEAHYACCGEIGHTFMVPTLIKEGPYGADEYKMIKLAPLPATKQANEIEQNQIVSCK